MDMKKLIAQMDAIEKGKKVIVESAAPVVEYKGGTDAEKIKNWQQHIKNFDAFPKAQDDARQAAKKAQPGAKFYKTDDKPKKEGMGSIARALMQDMAVDEEGNYPLDEPVQPQAGIPQGPSFFKDPSAALKHAWKYRTDPTTGQVLDKRAKAQLNNPDPNMSGDANIAGAANSRAAAPAPTSDQGAEVGAPPAQYDVDQAANIDSTSQSRAPAQPDVGTPELNIGQGATPAAPPTTGSEMDTPAPAGMTPASQTKPAAPTTGSEMDTPAPAGMTPASQGKPAAQAATTQAGKAKPAAPAAGGWQAIYQMNKDVIGANPNLIKPGQQLKMPDGSTYVVKPGDTLGKIAGGGKQASASPPPAGKQAPGVDQGGPVEENINLIKRLAGI